MPNRTATFEQFKARFTSALRGLCEQKGSISVVCKDLNINRQQFAKYLSGTNLPSAYLLQRLVLYFSIDPGVFFLQPRQRHRFVSKAPEVVAQTGPMPIEGFYLEHTLSSRDDSLLVGLWRFERAETKMFCHGEIPRAREGRKHTFESFDGQVLSWGKYSQLLAFARNGSEVASLTFSPFDMSVSDLLAVRTTSASNKDTLMCTPSIFRYVGQEVDIAKSLMTQCGIVKLSRLDERSAAIVKLLAARVSPHGNGFRMSV